LMNRSLHTGTGLDNLADFAGKRPDVFGVKRGANGNPILFVREIRSPSQTFQQVQDNLAAIVQALRDAGFNNIDALAIDLPY